MPWFAQDESCLNMSPSHQWSSPLCSIFMPEKSASVQTQKNPLRQGADA